MMMTNQPSTETQQQISSLESEIQQLTLKCDELTQQLATEKLHSARLHDETIRHNLAGQPTIVIWIGPDGRPRCEAPSLNGNRNLRPELVTTEQINLLYDCLERQKEKAKEVAAQRNAKVWQTTAHNHGPDFANDTIGKIRRPSPGRKLVDKTGEKPREQGFEIIHRERTRVEKARDLFDHEIHILSDEGKAEALRAIPRSAHPLGTHQMHQIARKALARYGFTDEEIAKATAAHKAKRQTNTRRTTKPPIELLLDL